MSLLTSSGIWWSKPMDKIREEMWWSLQKHPWYTFWYWFVGTKMTILSPIMKYLRGFIAHWAFMIVFIVYTYWFTTALLIDLSWIGKKESAIVDFLSRTCNMFMHNDYLSLSTLHCTTYVTYWILKFHLQLWSYISKISLS